MDIQKEEILKLAELSMLKFNEKELEVLTHDFKEFLVYIQEIMTIEAMNDSSRSGRINVFREDKVIMKDREDILNQAPVRSGDYFAVPSILENTES